LTRVLGICAVVFFAASAAAGGEGAGPPKFRGAYRAPPDQMPAARPLDWPALDVAVLAGALALASYLALRRRSRRGLVALMLASLLYFGFWRGGCVCPIGAIQNVSRGLFDPGYIVPWAVVAFFALPLVTALLFGRTFCAAVCPLGAIQDVVVIKPVKVPPALAGALGLLPWVYLSAAILLAATGSAFIICRYDPFVSFFRLVPIGKWLAPSLPGGTGATAPTLAGRTDLLVLGASALVIGMFVGRAYCRFVCPYGALLGLLSRASRWRVSITPDECIQCRLCEDACPFGAIRAPTPERSAGPMGQGKTRLAWMLATWPILIAAGAAVGWGAGWGLAGMNAEVNLARRVWAERNRKVDGTTDASDAFRRTGRSYDDLYASANAVRDDFRLGGALLGGFCGLLIGGRLVRLSVRRRRVDYEADPAECLACGRCFAYCPREHQRRKRRAQPGGPI